MAITQINVPDIGDFDTVEVIEILVKVGDNVNVEDSLITLESDKASMEIPSTHAGVVESIAINIGDKIGEGSAILTINTSEEATPTTPAAEHVENNIEESTIVETIEVKVPDIGDFDTVEVIEVLVNVGDNVNVEDSLITLESDKASMEIPSTHAGVVESIAINIGDKIGEGATILTLTTSETNTQTTPTTETVQNQDTQSSSVQNQNTQPSVATAEVVTTHTNTTKTPPNLSHASPSTRKLARELGVDLTQISGSGQKGRITEEDLKGFVKNAMQNGGNNAATGSGIPAIPSVDFSKFGEIEEVELSRINKISAKHLHACWLNIPHVTQFDEANIDELEVFRKIQKSKGNKLTPIVFIIKAVIHCLKLHPKFNSSLNGDKLVLKKYFHIGVAVDTPNGLMVPVIKNADTKSLTQLQEELVALAKKARDGKLSPSDMSGACFTISSLGGIGGTSFTPIVNAPEVAILGVSKSQVKPIWNGQEFIPATILPLSLSYDHRVIDGALGARFISDLSSALEDIREILL